MKNNPPQKTPPAWLLLLPVLAVVALVAAAAFLPGVRLWGVNHLSFYPTAVRVAALVLLGASFVPLVARAVHALLERELTLINGRRRAIVFVLVLAVLAFALFTAFRSETLLLGDGQLLVTSLNVAFRGDSTVFFPTLKAVVKTERIAPGASLLYYITAVGVVKTTDRGAVDGVRLTTFILGVILVCVILWIVFRSSIPLYLRMWLGILVLTSGAIELFFGYVEYYAPMMFFGALYIIGAWRVLHQRGRLWSPVIFAGAAAYSHVQGILLLPSLLWLVLWRFAAGRRGAIERFATPAFAVLAVVGAILVGALTPLGRFFLPVFASAESYGILSPTHWVDITNELLLVLPTLPLFVVMAAAVGRGRSVADADVPKWFGTRPEWHFTSLVLAPCLLYMVAFRPEIGMARDWDLFAVVALGFVPLALLVVRRFVVATGSRGWMATIVGPALALSVVLCASWIGVNARGDATATRLASILEYDPSGADYAYENLRAYYYERNRLPEALWAQEKAVAISKNPRQILNLATLYIEYGDVENAIHLYQQILKNRPRYPRARERLILILYTEKRYREAAEVAHTGTELEPSDGMFHYFLGKSLVALGDFEAAVPPLTESLRLGPPPSIRDDINLMLERIGDVQKAK